MYESYRGRLAALCLLLCPVLAAADANSARSTAAAWLIKQQRGDGSWQNADGEQAVQATALALQALRHAGLQRSPTFGSGLSWLSNAEADSVDSLARKADVLAINGAKGVAQADVDKLYAMRTIAEFANWGGYGGASVEFIDTALGLTALRSADSGYGDKLENTVYSAYCDAYRVRISVSSGKFAWPLTKPNLGDQVVGRPSVFATTAMLLDLRGMQRTYGPMFEAADCGDKVYSISKVIAESQAWLADQQNPDGGFGETRHDGSKGASVVAITAHALRALAGYGVTAPAAKAQAWLLSQQSGSGTSAGSWRGDPLVTALALTALPAAGGAALADADQDGITDVVEAALGTAPTIADGRMPLKDPGRGDAGVHSSAFAVGAQVGKAFNYDLGSGTGYALSAGSLPPGLAVDAATGLITGTPTIPGSYAFDFRAGGASPGLVIGRIDVAAAAAPPSGEASGDVPLPLWALVGLGALLLRLSQRSRRS